MSKYSGEFDLCDEIEIAGGFDSFKGMKVFIGSYDNPLQYENLLDLMPYFAHIPVASSVKSDGTGKILLSERSYIDRAEERYGSSEFFDWCREELKHDIREEQQKTGTKELIL